MATPLDSLGSSRNWWECLTEDEARNPLPAIYEAQIQIDSFEHQLKTAQKALDEHVARLVFLREVVQQRIGVKVNELNSNTLADGERE